MFKDRREAGQLLALELERMGLVDPVVLALPRGGVPVAIEVALRLKAPLDLLIVRKIGAPDNPELALGAIVGSDPPDLVINEDVRSGLHLGDDYLLKPVEAALAEIERRRKIYLGNRIPVAIADKTVVIVDDGIATGSTIKVAIRSVKRRRPLRTIVAVPVAPRETIKDIEALVDRVVCLHQPSPFLAVGYHYADFGQLNDADVVRAIAAFDLSAAGRSAQHT